MAPYDFTGLIVWIILTVVLYSLNKKYETLVRGDFIFISIVLLILIELLWLRIGY